MASRAAVSAVSVGVCRGGGQSQLVGSGHVAQIVRSDGVLCPQTRRLIAEIGIAVAATVQHTQGNTALSHVGHGGIHQLAHVALAAYIGVYADASDGGAPQRACAAGQRERVGTDGGDKTAILPHQIVFALGGGIVGVELGQHPGKIVGSGMHAKHHIDKIADFAQLIRLAAGVGDCHRSLQYKLFLGTSYVIIFF